MLEKVYPKEQQYEQYKFHKYYILIFLLQFSAVECLHYIVVVIAIMTGHSKYITKKSHTNTCMAWRHDLSQDSSSTGLTR